MNIDPYIQMQKAVDIVNSSPHPRNKIAATIAGMDQTGHPYSLSFTNYWPEKIRAHFDSDARIGDASGTVHAETACLLNAPFTEGAAMFVTDPFCPNCAKNMAEAGIKSIYIDHKGFNKDFAARRHESFIAMSMQVCAKAGMAIYEIWRKEQKIEAIYEPDKNYSPPEDNPLDILALDDDNGFSPQGLKNIISEQSYHERFENFATALIRNQTGACYAFTASPHPVVGYTRIQDHEKIENGKGKYSFVLEPLNRLLMNAPRRGVRLVNGLLYASQVPTAREQVNLVGAGVDTLYIGDLDKARDEQALAAKNTLEAHNILTIKLL